MERKRKSVLLAFGLSLILFVLMVVFGSRSRYDYDIHDPYADVFGLNVDMRWVLKGNQADFEAVQDTLNYYAMALSEQNLTSRADWRLDHCCGDMALRQVGDGDMYHLKTAMNFYELSDRKDLYNWMYVNGWINFSKYETRYGMASGTVNLHLPMPTQAGKILHITGSQFEATFFANDWLEKVQS